MMSARNPSLRVPWRLRSSALPTLAAAVAIAVFVAAGNWQGRRMAQKEALRAQFDAAQQAPAMPLATDGHAGPVERLALSDGLR